MSDWMVLTNFSLGIVGMTLTFLGLILSILFRPVERWTRGFFIVNFSILFVYSVSIVSGYWAVMRHDAPLIKISIFIESLSSSLIMPLLTRYLMRLCGENRYKTPQYLLILSLWTVYFVLLVYNQFSGAFYYISTDGIYHRGPLYPLLLLPPAIIMLLNLIFLFWKRKYLSRNQQKAISSYFAFPLAGMLFQMYFYGLLSVGFGTLLGALTMFVFILGEQLELAISQAEENARKEFGIRVLQMRPHFIYNVMTSIYYLVDSDPAEAKEALQNFQTYLHQNFSAVVKTEMIPFEDELRHTRAFLAVEQTRFGSQLKVDYDMPHTAFSLPPLTLEPIVENAVRHGMDPESEPLHIIIHTRSVKDGSEIIVENNGTDYVPGAPAEKDHIGLDNVQSRLSQMCGGSLSIIPRPGSGTIVKILIPGKRAHT